MNENDELPTEETKEETEGEEQLLDIVSDEVNQVEESMEHKVPEPKEEVRPKSTYHSCTYNNCHSVGHMLYKVASKKCNTKGCTNHLHHICMIEYSTAIYGDLAESFAMSKRCKSCCDGLAKDLEG